jgi:hypothetical protein
MKWRCKKPIKRPGRARRRSEDKVVKKKKIRHVTYCITNEDRFYDPEEGTDLHCGRNKGRREQHSHRRKEVL